MRSDSEDTFNVSKQRQGETVMKNRTGKSLRPDTLVHIFIIALAIFILGVQVGITHGRKLQLEDLELDYGIIIPNKENPYFEK